jgi:hypothetical protein
MVKIFQVVGLVLLMTISLPSFGQEDEHASTKLLDRLAGNWVLDGMLGEKHTTHDVDAEWILNHEYLRLHELSREKNKSGGAAYEAIILFGWDKKANEYRCLWLDNTDGGGLSVPIARAKREGQSIQLAFPPPYDSLHTRFDYDQHSDRWRLVIDNNEGGKPKRFGDVTLSRAPTHGS